MQMILLVLNSAVGEQDIKRGVSILDCFEPGRREWVQERLEGSTTIESVSQETESTKRRCE